MKRKMTEFNAVDFDLAAIVDIIDVRELRSTDSGLYTFMHAVLGVDQPLHDHPWPQNVKRNG